MPTLSAEWKPGTSNTPFIINHPVWNQDYAVLFATSLLYVCGCLCFLFCVLANQLDDQLVSPLERRYFNQKSSFWLNRACSLHTGLMIDFWSLLQRKVICMKLKYPQIPLIRLKKKNKLESCNTIVAVHKAPCAPISQTCCFLALISTSS